MDDFERELRQAFERRPAPPGFKRRLMEQRGRRRTERLHGHMVFWQRLAASLALAALVGGGWAWRHAEERRKGEEARAQVLTALRITSHALHEMNTRLATHSRAGQQPDQE